MSGQDPAGHLPGNPPRDPARAGRRARLRARENFRGGPGARPGARPGAGAPRGAPGTRPGSPSGTPPGSPSRDPLPGPISYSFVLQTPPKGGVLGCPFWAAREPPREGGSGGAPGGRPGGQKSAHFFGYLITLPVGTVWATFSGPGTARPDGQKPPLARPSPEVWPGWWAGSVFMWSLGAMDPGTWRSQQSQSWQER